MALRRVAGAVGSVLVAVFLVSMIAGQVLGQPVLLGYVTTGSMQPTLDPGDGFVAVPSAVAGPVESGDVVVFRAEEIQGGGLTTHRVVEETDRGYITRGDDNPFTDQDSDEPPVQDAQIVAIAWQPGGDVLVIPELGTLVMGIQGAFQTVQQRLAAAFGTRALLGTQGFAYLLLGISVIGYVLDLWMGDGREKARDTSRSTGIDARLVVGAAIVLSATATMVVPAGPQEFGVVSAESDSPGIRVVEQGATESTTYRVGNGGYVPMVTYFEPTADGVDIQPRELTVPGNSIVNATVTVTAPPETGYYRYYVTEHRYLAVLPRPAIDALYRIHPWAPIVAIDVLFGGGFYLVGRLLVGSGQMRSRARDGPSRVRRLRNRFSS